LLAANSNVWEESFPKLETARQSLCVEITLTGEKDMSKIHFYDAETGYIHYVSEVIPNLECRVYDPVSNLEDVMVCRDKAVQFVPQASGFNAKVAEKINDLILEGIEVSNEGLGFMDAIMHGSPFRDKDKWVSVSREKFVAEREERKRKWNEVA